MDMMDCKFLADYPALEAWYESEKNIPVKDSLEFSTASKKFRLDICHCLTLDLSGRYSFWSKRLHHFLDISSDPQVDFSISSDFFMTHEIDLQILASDMGFIAFEMDEGTEYFSLMQEAAEKTCLVSFRFLTAWLALNLNKPEICIEECDKVDSAFAPIYTIQGQALLEIGKAIEAVEALNVAVSLDTREVLAFFQLAKAHLVLGQTDKAWDAAISCLNISPDNNEIGLLLTMIALEGESTDSRVTEAWNILSPNLHLIPSNPILIVNLLDLAFRNGNKEWAEKIVELGEWSNLFLDQDFIKNLGPILRNFGDLAWMDLANIVLEHFNEQNFLARTIKAG